MLTGRNKQLKPQDILVLLKIIALKSKPWRILDLAFALNLSPSETSLCLERLKLCHLIQGNKKKINKECCLEFLFHGLKYIIPTEIGEVRPGVLTAHSILSQFEPPISDARFVWPTEIGEIEAQTLKPIYETVPQAALKDLKLHQILAHIDVVRLDRIVDRDFAKYHLSKEIYSCP